MIIDGGQLDRYDRWRREEATDGIAHGEQLGQYFSEAVNGAGSQPSESGRILTTIPEISGGHLDQHTGPHGTRGHREEVTCKVKLDHIDHHGISDRY